jgi:integrase
MPTKKLTPPYCCWISEKLYARISYQDSQGKWKQASRLVKDELGIPSESPKDAARMVRQLQNEFDQKGPEAFSKDKTTLDAFLDQWLAVVKPNIRERTYDDYENILRRYVRPSLGKRRVSDLDPKDIQRLIAAMQEKKLAPRTIRYMHAVVSMALKYAVFPCRLLKFNPADARANYVKLPKQDRKDRVWLNPESARKFLDALDNEPQGLMLEFALMTGLRPSEYMALQWSDDGKSSFVDLKRAAVTVRQTIFRKRKGGGWSFEEAKTDKSRRTITFPRYLVQKLIEHKRKQNEERLKLGPQWKDHNLVFPSDVGTPFAIWNIHQRHFKPILKKAELPDMRLYDLRHSFATLLLAKREPTKIVSEMLGHADPSITMKIYQQVDEPMMRETTDALEKMFKR